MFNSFPNSLLTSTRTFFYADPDVGGGKTYSLGQLLAHPFSGKSIVGIQSIPLAKEIEASLASLGIKVMRIDTDRYVFDPETPTITCTSIFNEALKADEHQVFIVNQDVALRADPVFSRDYTLYMDEVPSVHDRIWLNGIVTSHKAVTSYLTSMPVPKVDGLRQIISTDEGENFLKLDVKELQAKSGKDLFDAVSKVHNRDHYDVFAEEKVWSDFRSGMEPSIVLHSIMKPAVFDKFAATHILGANFTLSLMNLIWSRFYGAKFDISHKIMENVRYQKLSEVMSDQVLVYFHSEKNCSKYTYSQIDYQPTYDASFHAVTGLLAELGFPADTRHLLFRNNKPKEVKEPFRWLGGDLAIPFSPSARGVDAFKDVDVAIHLAACNENADTYRVLQGLFGLSKDQIDKGTVLERAYQAIGRSSIRDMYRKERTDRPVVLVFFDYRAAKFVADIVGCGEPVFLDTGIAALNEEKKTVADYNTTAYHKKNVKVIADLPHYDGFIRRKWMDRFSETLWDEMYPTWAEWVADSLESSRTPTPKKENAAMYREGAFKSDETHKVKGNIQMTKVITLDFDDVTADPADLSVFLTSKNITHLITNSYSSTVEAPRFRLDIPLSAPVNSYGYSHVASHLLADLDEAFGAGTFIADKGKKTIMARFHMPSESVFDADLFINATVKNADGDVFLNVTEFMAREPIVQPKEDKAVVVIKSAKGPAMTVDDVLSKWSVPAGMGEGSRHFHQAAIDLLFKVKLSREEAITVLDESRFRFGRGDDRNAEYVVDDVLRTSSSKAA